MIGNPNKLDRLPRHDEMSKVSLGTEGETDEKALSESLDS